MWPSKRLRRAGPGSERGITLIEIVIVLAMIGALVMLARPGYRRYVERARRMTVIADFESIEAAAKMFEAEKRVLPGSLAQIGYDNLRDPWGNPYQYLNLRNGPPSVTGKARKDKNLVPINSDFDLYSMGPDGDTKTPLTAPQSHDDIIRANDGAYLGEASQY